MKRLTTVIALGLLSNIALTACSKARTQPEQTTPVSAPAPQVAAEPAAPAADDAAYTAKTLFQQKCVVCHGSVGLGDGPGAAALNPKPRAFADGTWQASVGDEQIENTILMGGPAVGKSPAMPANPDLQSKPAVVKELVKIVRGFKKG
jgi:mono/diheme cytochrome c family protein